MDTWNWLPVIDDTADDDLLYPAGFGRGHDPAQYVPEMFAAPDEMPLIDPSEYAARCDEQAAQESSLEHLYRRAGWENLDQNGHGYCWAYSTGHCVMVLRTVMNQPHVRLNPHSVAAVIKGGRDEGGWCGLSARHLQAVGVASEEFWPAHSRSLANDTPAMRANAALHKVTEDWYDLARPVHGQQLTDRQVATCLLNNQPCAADFNWWGHSVCALRWVKVEAGSYGLVILNSWKGWGDRGLAVLRGSKARPDGAVSIRVTGASVS